MPMAPWTQSPAGGVYLVNLTVRAGVRSGDVDLDISSPDAYDRSVLIQVGSGTTGADFGHSCWCAPA